MKTVENYYEQIARNNEEIARLNTENKQLLDEVAKFNPKDRDYISLQNACKKFNVSYIFLYRKVQTGELVNYSKGSRILVKESEVENCLVRSA